LATNLDAANFTNLPAKPNERGAGYNDTQAFYRVAESRSPPKYYSGQYKMKYSHVEDPARIVRPQKIDYGGEKAKRKKN
jgi:hypothetical protein